MYAGTDGIPMPSKTAISIVSKSAIKSKNGDPVTLKSMDVSTAKISLAMYVENPVKLRQKSITETLKNIKYNVEIITPAFASACSILDGCDLIFGSKNNSKSKKIHAHQPEDPASPAEF